MPLTVTPNSGQTLSNSRSQIAGNFALIQSAFTVDHVDFTAGNAGYHKFVSFAKQGSDPAPDANTIVMYNKTGSTAYNELFIERDTGSGDPVSPIEFTSAAFSTNGTTQLPSGIKTAWGQASITGGNSTIVISLSTLYSWTNVLSATVTEFNAAGLSTALLGVKGYTAPNKFTVYRNTTVGTTTFNYFAIGY